MTDGFSPGREKNTMLHFLNVFFPQNTQSTSVCGEFFWLTRMYLLILLDICQSKLVARVLLHVNAERVNRTVSLINWRGPGWELPGAHRRTGTEIAGPSKSFRIINILRILTFKIYSFPRAGRWQKSWNISRAFSTIWKLFDVHTSIISKSE